MASSSSAAGGGGGGISLSGGADAITALKTQVYEACLPFLKDNPKVVFHQADIFEFDIIPNNDVSTLLTVAQKLLDEKLFKVVQNQFDGMGWKLRTVDEARKYVFPLS